MGLNVINSVNNRRKTPAIVSDSLANFPAVSFNNLVLIRQDAPFGIYQDINGVRTLIASPGGAATPTLQNVCNSGNSTTTNITAASFITSGGISSQFVKGNGSLDGNIYVTASSVANFTNKTGNISQWTNDVGYVTSAGAATSITGTVNQVLVNGLTTPQTGAITLTLPQDIAQTSNVVFGTITGVRNGATLISKNASAVAGLNWLAYQNSVGTEIGFVGYGTNNSNFAIQNTLVSNIILRNNAIDALVIDSTAAAVFNSTVTATSFITVGGTTTQYIRGDGSLTTFPTNVSSFTNDAGYVTASSVANFTNKTGNISQWTNDVGYLTTEVDTLASVTARGASTSTTLSLAAANFSGLASFNNAGGQMRLTGGTTDGGIVMPGGSNVLFLADYNTLTKGVKIDLSTGIAQTTSRLNVNAAVDNSLYSLNNNGTFYTGGFSPNNTAFSSNTTISVGTTYIFNGGAGVTFTMGNPSNNNQLYFVKNWSANTLTIAGFGGGTNIIDITNTAVASFLLLTGQTAILQQDGSTRTFILNIY